MNRVEALKLIEHDFPDYAIILKIFWSDRASFKYDTLNYKILIR
jgi:hypothetical protein